MPGTNLFSIFCASPLARHLVLPSLPPFRFVSRVIDAAVTINQYRHLSYAVGRYHNSTLRCGPQTRCRPGLRVDGCIAGHSDRSLRYAIRAPNSVPEQQQRPRFRPRKTFIISGCGREPKSGPVVFERHLRTRCVTPQQRLFLSKAIIVSAWGVCVLSLITRKLCGRRGVVWRRRCCDLHFCLRLTRTRFGRARMHVRVLVRARPRFTVFLYTGV